MKNKETLEEAAENNYPEGDIWTEEQAVIRRLAFKNGAKWQQEQFKNESTANYIDRHIVEALVETAKQERMYSEEDLREAYFSAIKDTGEGWNGEYAEGNDPDIREKFSEGFELWFDQFKKK